jgi:hypothetical protein
VGKELWVPGGIVDIKISSFPPKGFGDSTGLHPPSPKGFGDRNDRG